MLPIVLYIVLGTIAGALSGLIGIGGGIIIIPALVYLFGLSQQQAQGTTLALLVPPIGLFAAWAYYKQGYVDLKIAALICIGFVLGSMVGSHLAFHVSTKILTKIFCVFLLFIAIKMLLSK